jgi:CDP-diacylglycerol---serine O-phosphatidyltransferase
MESIKKGLPSFFTSLGLISGCLSIVFCISYYQDLAWAGYFILIAAVFDFIDGFVARLVHHVSEFGKQLDSLADVISFGVAPSVILYRLMVLSYVNSSPKADFDLLSPDSFVSVVIFSPFLVAVFSALRLAKFNLDPKQTKNFRGLPVPANALFIAGLGFGAEVLPNDSMVFTKGLLLTVVIIACFLLVSNIGMFSLKFSSYNFKKNFLRYLFLAIAAVLLVISGLPGISLVILLYIVMSVANTYVFKME